ncbi:MAG: hypothetical protein WCO78_03690 [Candidatus Roizmanbacteria bacterium]
MKCIAEVGPGGRDLIGIPSPMRRLDYKELAIYPEGLLPCDVMVDFQRNCPSVPIVRANIYRAPEFVSKVTAAAGPVDILGIFNVTNDPEGEEYRHNRGPFAESVKGVLPEGGMVFVSEQYSYLKDDHIRMIRADLTRAGFQIINYMDDLWRSMATMGLRNTDGMYLRIMSILRSEEYSFDRFAIARKVTPSTK